MQRMSPVVGVVLMVSVLFMAATAIILWVQSRPTSANELVAADGVAQEEPAAGELPQEEAVPAENGGLVTYDIVVEGEIVQLVTVQEHEKLTVYVPPAEPAIIEPEPIVLEDNNPVEVEAEAVVVEVTEAEAEVVVEAEPPTPTPIIAEVEPQVVEDVATPEPTIVVINGQPVIFVPHLVQAGDTMYNVAQRLGSSVELMAENGISSDDMIVGETISVPVANSAYCSGMTTYVVRDADTVYSIATRFNVDKDLIRDQNNLGAEYSIRAGQVICIPPG